MKANLSRILRSGLAMLLVLCMVVGYIPAVVFANDDEAPKKYVSLGDSMANGYGFEGYGDGYNGYKQVAKDAYPYLLSQAYGWELNQMALSGMRVEDLHWLLEYNYEDPTEYAAAHHAGTVAWDESLWDEDLWYATFAAGDMYTATTFTQYGWKVKDTSVETLAKEYQEAVADADIITFSAGNANFGVFMVNQLMGTLGFSGTPADNACYNLEAALRNCSPELREEMLQLENSIEQKIDAYLQANFGMSMEDERLQSVKRAVVYTAVSYTLNYAGVLEAILEVNPDVEIILVGIMNTLSGVELTNNGEHVMYMSEIMDLIVEPVNTYMAALPAIMKGLRNDAFTDAKFYYAEAPKVECIVETYGENIYEEGNVIRKRFHTSIVGTESAPGMIWGLLGDMVVPVDLTEIKYYESLNDVGKLAYAAANSDKAMSIAMYLAFEKAIIAGKDSAVDIESLMGLGSIMSGNPFGPIMEDFYAAAAVAGAQKQAAVAKFVELTLENKVDEMLAANNIPGAVDITLSADDIAAIISGDPDAANVIAAKTVDAIVKVVSPVRDAAIADGVCNGVDAFLTGIETVLSGQGITVDLTLGGYYSTAYGETWTGSPEQKIDLAVNFAEDGDVYGFDGWLTSYVAYAIADAKGTDVYEIFGDAQAAVAGAYSAAQTTIDEAISAVWMLDSEMATREQIDNLLGGEPGDEPGDIAEAYIAGMVSQTVTSESASLLCTLLVMPEVLGKTIANSELSGLLALFARCIIGDGLGAHPSVAGHKELFNAIKKSYDEDYTAEDKMNDLAIGIAKDVWAQWVEQYGPSVQLTIDKLIALAEERRSAYEDAADKIGAELDELLATKEALEAELAVLKAQLAQKKAELEEVLAKQEISGVTAPNINIEIDPDLGNNTQTTVPGNDCTVGSDSAKTELEKAIADLEHAIAVLEALVSDISADIADMAKVAAELGEAIAELSKTMKQLAAAGKDLAEAIAAVADVLTNESGIATAEQIKKVFEIALVAAEEAADIIGVAKDMLPVLSEDIGDAMDILVTDITALYEQILTDIPKAIEYRPEAKIALGAILVLVNENKLTQEEAEALIEEKLAELKNSEEYKKAEQDLKNLKAEIELEITTRYEAAKEQLTAEANAKLAILNAKKAALEAEIEELKAQLAAAEEAVKATIQAQIDRLTGDLAMVDADIAHINEHLKAALEIAYEEIVAEVNALYAEAVAALEAKIRELTGMALDELLNLGTETLNSLLETLKNKGEEAIIVVGNKLVELLNQMMDYATRGEVLAGVDMKYVALGDGSNDFAAVLSELLKGKAPANFEFVNATKPGSTVADVAANLPADVIGANVITLGFSQTEIIGKALSAFLNGEELNWTELVGADVAPYAAVALEYVYGEIDAMELDEKTAAMVKAIAEAYAYGVAEYAINLPILIKNIREVNKTAEIVIVGMHNPLENLSIELPIYGKIDLSAYGELFNYLVDGVYGYGVALSVIAKDVTYVDARDVEIEKNVLGLKEVDALLKGDISALYPSANGDAYIAEQINNALTVKMLGDANDDGVVDSYDATLIARYDVGLIGANDLNLAVCDVNGDGVVDSYDATLVARYDVGLLAA